MKKITFWLSCAPSEKQRKINYRKMPSSLLPEKSLVISPSLAATIGLEEAVMFQGLHERMRYSKAMVVAGFKWYGFEQAQLEESFPFWPAGDIQRIAHNLEAKGILVLDKEEPYLAAKTLKFALNEKVVSAVENVSQAAASTPTTTPTSAQAPLPEQPAPAISTPINAPVKKTASVTQKSGGAQKMSPQWQPDKEILKKITKLGIPDSFVNEHIPDFTCYWIERDQAHYGWGNKFLNSVKTQWVKEETVFAAQQKSNSLDDGWFPSEDALEILTRAGIQEGFISEAVPEFVLYWRERGDNSATWNSKFVQHVRRQWARYCQALEYDTEPRTITANWKPSQDVFDILHMATIEKAFAESLIPEFVVFWRDSNQLHSSWNSKFLQHVKYHWAKRHKMANPNQAKTAEQDFVELHTNNNWADGL